MKKHLIYIIPALITLALGFEFLSKVRWAIAAQQESACLALSPEEIFSPAPNLSFKDLQNKSLALANFKDKAILLNFWATWCPPCVEEFPSLINLSAKIANPKFVSLAISVDEDQAALENFLAQANVNSSQLKILRDPQKEAATTLGTQKFPETYLIDRQGQIKFRFINKRQWDSPAALACINSLLRD